MLETRSKSMIGIVLLGVTILVALLLLIVRGSWLRLTAENYDRIRVGMTRADVERILGKPRYDTAESGVIGKTGAYVTNDSLSEQEQLEQGYRSYRRLQWMSAEITIVVVFDSSGGVATRYRGEGQSGGNSFFPW